MAAVRVKTTFYKSEIEKILKECNEQVKLALHTYQKEIRWMVEDVKDSMQIIEAEKPFS